MKVAAAAAATSKKKSNGILNGLVWTLTIVSIYDLIFFLLPHEHCPYNRNCGAHVCECVSESMNEWVQKHVWMAHSYCYFFIYFPSIGLTIPKNQIHSPRTMLCLRLFIMKIIGINAQFDVNVNVNVCESERLCVRAFERKMKSGC